MPEAPSVLPSIDRWLGPAALPGQHVTGMRECVILSVAGTEPKRTLPLCGSHASCSTAHPKREVNASEWVAARNLIEIINRLSMRLGAHP
jgi:hypothetical protein